MLVYFVLLLCSLSNSLAALVELANLLHHCYRFVRQVNHVPLDPLVICKVVLHPVFLNVLHLPHVVQVVASHRLFHLFQVFKQIFVVLLVLVHLSQQLVHNILF